MTEVVIPDPETLHLIVGDVFTGLLGDVEPPLPDDATAAELPVLASVSVTGGWNGRVVIECSAPLARLVTSQLLLTSEDQLVDDDVRDVVGELANVIGGNVKSVMPGPSTLSLPSSSLVGDRSFTGDGVAAAVQFAWRQEPLRVSVFTDEPAAGRNDTEVES
jgi:chemotaxis protein CheX